MKLLMCRECWDMFKLAVHEDRKCKCGLVSGRYIDDLNAWYSGETAIPIGFNNSSLRAAMRDQPLDGMGVRFEAFVIPKVCPTFKKVP